MDVEDYYFRESKIPYSDARSKDEVVELMLADIKINVHLLFPRLLVIWGM